MQQQILLKTEKLCKTFSNGGQQQHVLKNIDLELYKGDFTVIMGASGAGKSTLLYALSGMDTPTLVKLRSEIRLFPIYRKTVLRFFAATIAGLCFNKSILLTECLSWTTRFPQDFW